LLNYVLPKSLVIVVKFSCQSKLYWMFGNNSKFKIQTFQDWSELRQSISSYTVSTYSLYSVLPITFLGKVVHTSLFCLLKISYQSKKHFSRRRFNLRCVFCNFFCYFLTFQSDIFHVQWVYRMTFISPMYLYVGLEAFKV